jgi:uncharacterized protein
MKKMTFKQSSMKKIKIHFIAISIISTTSFGASFDCSKVKSNHEKHICNTPELSILDEKMGNAFKKAKKLVPLNGLVLETQRHFLLDYNNCLYIKGNGKQTPEGIAGCVEYLKARINELDNYAQSTVYSDADEKYISSNLALLLYSQNNKKIIQLWGNYMPDAYDPKPFPNGVVCDISAELIPIENNFKTLRTGDVLFKISNKKIIISNFISCSPRNGISSGEYLRIK